MIDMAETCNDQVMDAAIKIMELEDEIERLLAVLDLTASTLPALRNAKGYDKIGAVIVARALAELVNNSPDYRGCTAEEWVHRDRPAP